ncbi:MAG: ATP-binding protein, partial [Ktedonobacteraceae bacterium]|nr:ATP-binding protein [Ktedonobacteraceae bacterium]
MREALTPQTICPTLIGRTEHRTSLHQRIELTKERVGGLVLISGEAGIGKSRLVVEAKKYALAQGFLLLQGNCFLTDLNCPYAPLLDLWRSFFAHLSPHDIDAENFAQEFFPLLPELVSGPALP